jgi:hypothetical protein
MFSGRRDRVWSDNSIHLFYCSQKPAECRMLFLFVTSQTGSSSSPLRQPRGNEPQDFDECWADTLAFRS